MRRRRLALAAVLVLAAAAALALVQPFADKAVKELALPLRHDDVIRQQAADKDLDPALIAAVIYAESQFRNGQTSSAGALGAHAGHARHRPRHRAPLGRHDASSSATWPTPQVNISYGAYYLRFLLDHYGGNEAFAIAAYNAGAGQRRPLDRGRPHGGRALTPSAIPFPETRALRRPRAERAAAVPRLLRLRARPRLKAAAPAATVSKCPQFKLDPIFTPAADQPAAIARWRIRAGGERFTTLLGATGTGKTMTMAGVIERRPAPALVIAHNKTLAAQLCNEFRTFFPDNAVEYFVSYYDYYQPEAYVPSKDLYIEKDSAINQEIDRLRHAATAALFARRDVIIVASVSRHLRPGLAGDLRDATCRSSSAATDVDRDALLRKLVSIQYSRNDQALGRGTFRVRGETLEVFPAYAETAFRATFFGDEVERLQHFDPLTGELIADDLEHVAIWPATHYNVKEGTIEHAVARDRARAQRALRRARGRGQAARESHRLRQRTQYDMEMLREMGFCNGIENYSRILDGRAPGRPPVLPASTTSPTTSSASSTSPTRPCRRSAACTRATARASRRSSTTASGCPARWTTARRPSTSSCRSPRSWCSSRPRPASTSARTPRGSSSRSSARRASSTRVVEVRETRNQIDDLMNEVRERVDRDERVLVTTLTKKMSEDLTDYLLEMGFKVRYLHSEIDTLERIQIIRDLRLGEYDVLVGVNLLREGLDLPEVSLVAILDADKEGFLRGETSLIQTIGRAARNVDGHGAHVRRQGDRGDARGDRRDRPPPRDPARLQRGARDHGGDDRQGHLRHRRVPAGRGQDARRAGGAASARARERGGHVDERARADDRRARGGDARRRRRPALRVRRAAARRDPRAAPRRSNDAAGADEARRPDRRAAGLVRRATRRDLPWRRTRDPYAVLVSEVMLQQTQVARVVPRYEAWLERWPTAAALAAAPPAECCAAWVGLGYNRRAAAAARGLRGRGAPTGGRTTCATLPGRRAVHRGGGRLVRLRARRGGGRHERAARAARGCGRGGRGAALPPGRAAAFNQAMMDLGATVCRARDAALRRVPGGRVVRVARARRVARAAPGRSRERFEDTARWARGRVVAALAAGEALPPDVARGAPARARWPGSSATGSWCATGTERRNFLTSGVQSSRLSAHGPRAIEHRPQRLPDGPAWPGSRGGQKHLAAIADEAERLRAELASAQAAASTASAAPPADPSPIASQAGRRVEAIVAAAEASAAEIERAARQDAERTRAQAVEENRARGQELEELERTARLDAERTRAEAAEERRARVQELTAGAAGLRTRLEELDRALSALTERVGEVAPRPSAPAPAPAGEPRAASAPAAEGPAQVAPPSAAPAAPPAAAPWPGSAASPAPATAASPAPATAASPAEAAAPAAARPGEDGSPQGADAPPESAARADGAAPADGAWPAAAAPPAEVAPPAAAAQPEPPPAGLTSDIEGARLVLLNLALSGSTRDEADRYVAQHFNLPDRKALLDEVFASVAE